MKVTKTTKITLITIVVVSIAACHTSKKSTTTTASTTPVSTTPVSTTPTPTVSSVPSRTNSYLLAKIANGIYAPGDAELAAIQVQYKEVTLDKLKEGYAIYTEGACINCHGTKSIYKYGEVQWKEIVDDMAQKAAISDAQKDAVYKYVLAIKATQPKDKAGEGK